MTSAIRRTGIASPQRSLAPSPGRTPQLRRAAGLPAALQRCLLAAVLVPAVLQSVPMAGADEAPGYSYVELRAGVSKTRNEWPGAGSDASGRPVGFAASWKVDEGWYLTAGYSRERSRFSNEAAGTVLNLRARQAVAMAGGGRFWSIGSGADLYAEASALHSRVNHEHPDVRPAAGGRPTVAKRNAAAEDTGFGAAVGIRRMLNGATEIEGRFEVRDLHDFTESAIALAGRRSLTDRLSLGLHVSWGESTKRNTGATAGFGVALRHAF